MLWQLEEIKQISPEVRTLFDMKELVFDKRWLQRNIGKMRDQELYFEYKGVFKADDELAIRKSGLRYDIAIIPPLVMGDEHAKTAGYYNPISVDELTYPEVYQVVEGEAIFLIQKVDNFDRHNLIDVAFARAKAGEVFVVPPNFGHVIINDSKKRAVLAKWVADGFEPIYEPIERMCGAAYFFTKDGWVRNQRYGLIPQIREIKPRKMDDMYSYVSDLKRLGFLKNPTIRPEKAELPSPKAQAETKKARAECREIPPKSKEVDVKEAPTEPAIEEIKEDSPQTEPKEEPQTFTPVNMEKSPHELVQESQEEEPQPKKDKYKPIGF